MNRDDVRENMESFISEAEGLIEQMNFSIAGMDTGDSEKISEFMRSLHTLKGMAGMMGFEEMEVLCHKMEDMMRKMDVKGLYWGIDLLERMLNSIERGNDTGAFSGEVKGENDAENGKRDDWKKYTIYIKIRKKEPLKGVRAAIIKRDASALGRIISFDPEPVSIDNNFDGTIEIVIESLLEENEVISAILGIRGVESAWSGRREGSSEKKHDTVSPMSNIAQKQRTLRIETYKIDELQSIVEEAVISVHKARSSLSSADIERLSSIIERLADRTLALRAVPVKSLISRLHRVVKETALKEGKDVVLDVRGDDVEIDREIISVVGEALIHILRNAVSHGIETRDERLKIGKPAIGKIEMDFVREGSSIRIDVKDDGRGIDTEKLAEKAREMGMDPESAKNLLDLIFIKGVSTSDTTSSVSGRGVGLDMVKKVVEEQGGDIEVFTEPGTGTKFRIKLPFSTGIISALLVEISERYFAIPAESIEKICEIKKDSVTSMMSEKLLREGHKVHRILDIYGETGKQAIIVRFRGSTLAIPVNNIFGIDRIVLKRLDWGGSALPFRYVTLLSDGEMAFVLEAASIGRIMEVSSK